MKLVWLLLSIYTCSSSVRAATVDFTLIAKHKVINADGTFVRKALFNGSMPGPPIRCNVGDTLKIKVVNNMNKEELSVNWQGFSQTGTNHMDGVPYITEIPISPDGGYRTYEFLADKPGTFHYHSNQEMNRMSLFGIIIVDDPATPLVYDEELADTKGYPALTVGDWFHQPSHEQAAQLDNYIGDWVWSPQSSIVNGWGLYDCTIKEDQPYYFRCNWQCPSEDVECIDEVRCSKAKHPFSGVILGPYVWEEQGSNALYNALVESNPDLYTQEVEDAWAMRCGWDHLAPFLAGTPNEQTADGRVIGADMQRHQNQFNNWGRPTGVACNVPKEERDPRCLPDGTWPFKGLNKGRTYDHLRGENGYDVTHFDEADFAQFNAKCRATRFYTGDYQPESNHYPFGLWSQSRRDCLDEAVQEQIEKGPAVFEVEAGKTYRLRILDAATFLYSSLVIEGHSMSVVELDGHYVEPFDTNFLDMWNGQGHSVLFTADAEPGDYWMAIGHRQRGYTLLNPGRAILRYVTKDASGQSTPVVGDLPTNPDRPVPQWWDAAPIDGYTNGKPRACPVDQHPFVSDASRDMDACPGFFPHYADQDISMRLQYKFKSTEGNLLPALTKPDEPPVMMVQNMNAIDIGSIENYTTCSDDYGANGLLGQVYNGYSYTGKWHPRYSRFRPHTDKAGTQEECGIHRWSVNNITYPRRFPSSYTSVGDGYSQALLQHAYEGTFNAIPGIVDVKRPDETSYFTSFEWYQNLTQLGGNNKELLGIYPTAHELLNVMRFDKDEVFDVVMQNTVYLRFWTNAFYGDKHTHRQGSNHHPYHSHGFDFWALGYGEGNFDAAEWNKVAAYSDVPVTYEKGMIHFKNTINPAKRNLAVNFAGGWTVLRIKADNIGLWWFHCTVMAHWHMGMGHVFGFGLNEFEGKASPFLLSYNKTCEVSEIPDGGDDDDSNGENDECEKGKKKVRKGRSGKNSKC